MDLIVKNGGKMHLMQRKLKVKGFKKDLPNTIAINVEDLTIGKVLKVSDIKIDNLQLLNAKDSIVCAVKATRKAAVVDEEVLVTEESDTATAEEKTSEE